MAARLVDDGLELIDRERLQQQGVSRKIIRNPVVAGDDDDVQASGGGGLGDVDTAPNDIEIDVDEGNVDRLVTADQCHRFRFRADGTRSRDADVAQYVDEHRRNVLIVFDDQNA